MQQAHCSVSAFMEAFLCKVFSSAHKVNALSSLALQAQCHLFPFKSRLCESQVVAFITTRSSWLFSLFSHLLKYLTFYILGVTQGCSAVTLVQAVLTCILTPFLIHISVCWVCLYTGRQDLPAVTAMEIQTNTVISVEPELWEHWKS